MSEYVGTINVETVEEWRDQALDQRDRLMEQGADVFSAEYQTAVRLVVLATEILKLAKARALS